MPWIAAALDGYLQYREEKVKEEKEKYLAGMWLALRNAFADQAKVEAAALEAGIVKISEGPVASALAGLDAAASEVAAVDFSRAQLVFQIDALKARCTRLRTLIMSWVKSGKTED